MERPRIQGPLVALVLLVAQSALAQDAPAFVRRSTLPTPTVIDVEVLRQQRVEVPSLAILSDPQRSAVLQLDLFADISFRAVRDRLEPTAHGMSWVGKLDGYPESDAIFVLVQDELIGHIYTSFGFFRIERQPGGTYLAQQVEQGAFREGPDEILVPPEVSGRSADNVSSGRADNGSVIDILVAYTRDALAGFGSETRALASIDLSIAETNQSLRASRIPTQIRAVHTTVINYAETGDRSIDDSQLRDRVRGLRDLHAADVSAFIVERLDRYCGLGGGETLWVQRTCAGSGGTFAHEFGHVLDAGHDWYQDGPYSGSRPNYAHGFVSLPGRFKDVMSYWSLCGATRTQCIELLLYSNPGIQHNGRSAGVPAGTNVTCTKDNINNPDCDADNARRMMERAPTVGRYRHSLTALSARQFLPGASFRSASGRFRLTYQTDGNLVLYDDRDRIPLWATHTGGTSPGQAILQTDGNLVVYDGAGAAVYSSGTPGNPNAYLVVQDDGNLVIYDASDQPVWDRIVSPAIERWFAPAASPSVLGVDFSVFNGNVVQLAIEHRIDNIGGIPGNTCTARVNQTNISIPIVDGTFTVPFSVGGLSTVISGTFTSPTSGTGIVGAFTYTNWRCPGASGSRNGSLPGTTSISFSRR